MTHRTGNSCESTGAPLPSDAAGLVLAALTGALAKEYTAARKAGRGLAAMTTGFLRCRATWWWRPPRRARPRLTLGFVKGLGGIVVRELVGVYEFVTAPIEVPSGYRPLIAPNFRGTTRRIP
jgi:putative exosortase-associated protein (TIGR04073 family)